MDITELMVEAKLLRAAARKPKSGPLDVVGICEELGIDVGELVQAILPTNMTAKAFTTGVAVGLVYGSRKSTRVQ